VISTPVTHISRKGTKLINCSVTKQPPTSLVEFTYLLELYQKKPNAVIAIIRDGHLGDLIALTGAIAALKQWFPKFVIDVYSDIKFVGCMDWFDCVNSHRDMTYIKQHDLLINLQHYVEQSVEKHLLPRNVVFGRAFGLTDRCHIPKIGFKKETGGYVLIAPGASCAGRVIPDEIVSSIVSGLHYRGITSIITTESNTVLNDLPGLVGNALYVVCSDNGISHLSQACGTKALALFGPVDLHLRVDEYDCVEGLQSSMPCSPCDGDCENRGCMNYFDVERIVDIVGAHIAEESA
jgi:hypothetical protein